jgi:tripartite ATP-independent transporter DctM subunit
VVLFVLLALRMPVGLALLAVGFGGVAVLNGLNAAMSTMTSMTYSLSSNYTLVIVPLFVLMGNVASASGLSRRLFDAAYAWVGGMRGGLASASVVGCASFAAVSGSSIATAVTMGKVALPEMRRVGYSPSLATGAIAAGGTLGILIPPSAGFIVYALLTETSVGQLFIAGIVPGVLLTTLFVAVISLIATLRPRLAPPGPRTSAAEKLQMLIGATPMVAVILISIGGIYFGVFTPAEAAAVGAFLISVVAYFGRFLSLRQFVPVLVESARTTAMLLFIVIGAAVFSPFLSLADIPATLARSLAGLELGPHGTLITILFSYILLGTFLEGFAMMVITMPIVFPIILDLGFDPIWFGVLVVIVVEMSMITPPVGLNVFVVKGVAGPNVSMSEVFVGVLPFWAAMVACLTILVAFPPLSMFLPSTMFN